MRQLGFAALIAMLACNGSDKGDDTGLSVQDLDGDGYSESDGDCNDADAGMYPGAVDAYCDGIDSDCSGTDNDDQDGDGSSCLDDCDDFDGTVYPGADDFCGDGIDADCSGDLECDCDEDGFEGEQCDGGDCDDSDPDVNADGEDACYDGVDSNCDGADDNDCDGDGYASSDYGGEDCDDGDASIYPDAAEVCDDGIDNDCDVATEDCDCDGDGFQDVACGGDDCDDSDAAVGPGGDESSPNGVDDDCDGSIDEDGYCNLYFPTANGSAALFDYATFLVDGNTYTDAQSISAWDATTGEATFSRSLAAALSAWDIDEFYTCKDGVVSMSGFTLSTSGLPVFTAEYSSDRVVLPTEAELVEGTTWSYDYTATDASLGTLWQTTGTVTVLAPESITVTAGTFDAVVLSTDYELVGSGVGESYSRKGTQIAYYVARLGLVYSQDVDSDGNVKGQRTLSDYEGYYP